MSPGRKLRVAIVGCGKIADGHVEQIRATDRAEVTALCDSELLMAQQLALRMGVAATYSDLGRMLEVERPDVVHVATPPHSHLGIAAQCFAAGAHVFMEKPFALDARQTREILALAAAHQRLVSVNYLYNYETPYLELMEQVRQGALGRAVHLDVVYGYNLGGDYGMAVLADPGHWVHRLPGKLFHNVLDHVLAKAAPFLADVPMHAQAQVRRLRPASGNDALDAMPDELSFQVQAGELGISGMVSAHVRPVQHSLRVYGTKNSFALDIGARTFVPLAAQTLPSSAGRLFPAWRQAGHFRRNAWANARRFWRHEFHFFQGMRVLLTEFYGAIAEQAPEPLPPAIIQRTADVMDAVLESIGRASQRAGS